MRFRMLVVVLISQTTFTLALTWYDSGDVRWAFNCDFNGNDIGRQQSSGEQCGGICTGLGDCSHFTWTNYNGGTCWLKGGAASESSAMGKNNDNAVCGFLKSRSGGGGGGGTPGVTVKGTYWAVSSDPGGCQMPQGDYAITDAIALGQQPELGNLVWKSGLCGTVLNIDCGHGNVQAVVASTCNLGSGSCGVDMIQKTWNRATANQQPGVVSCKVSLSKTNPLREAAPVCYHRPNSELNNSYHTIVGVLNTSGRISSSATIGNKSGIRNNDGWFEFNGAGQPIFTPDSDVKFVFEDGSNAIFKLKDCKSGGQTQIFQ